MNAHILDSLLKREESQNIISTEISSLVSAILDDLNYAIGIPVSET